MFSALHKFHRDLLLEVLNLVRDYNGWPADLELRFLIPKSTRPTPPRRSPLTPVKMLLKTIAELKGYVSLATGNVGIPPAIALELQQVEAETLRPLLGGPLCAWLQAAYDAPGFNPAGPGLDAQLLRAVQRPLACLAVAAGITTHQTRVDDTGVHFLATETSKQAFQWQTNELQDMLLRRGHNGLDALVDWLEEHRADSPELKAWATSSAGQRHRRELFTSTAEFQEYELINGSRQVFEALRPMRRRMESFELQRVLGAEFLHELRE